MSARFAAMVGLFVATAGLAPANRLIVAAIDKYTGGNELTGCVADARELEASLKNYGFTEAPKELVDDQATAAHILAALDDAARDARSGDRIVFYFNGHGMDKPAAALCPFDFANGHLIAMADLSTKLKAIQAKGAAVTALLDCCFSGGLISKDVVPWRVKSIQAPISKGPQVIGLYDDPVRDAGPICYFAACTGAQRAVQLPMPGRNRPGGLFTCSLVDTLNAAPSKDETWGELYRGIAAEMQDTASRAKLTDPPQPELSDGYGYVPAFAGREAAKPPHASLATLQAVFNLTNPDQSLLDVEVSPKGVAQLLPGQKVSLKWKFGMEGYVVGLERRGNKYLRFYPKFPSGLPRFGPDSHLTPDRYLYFDLAGEDLVKFIIFKDRAMALKVAGDFPTSDMGGGLTEEQLAQALGKKDVESDNGPAFATFGFGVTVVDASPVLLANADLPLDAGEPLYRALKAPARPVEKFLAAQIAWEKASLLERFSPDQIRHDYVVFLINYVSAQSTVLYEKEAFAGITLSDETKAFLARKDSTDHPLSDAERTRLNVLLLHDAFPNLITCLPFPATTSTTTSSAGSGSATGGGR